MSTNSCDASSESMEVILSLGSNVGDRRDWLKRACEAFACWPHTSIVAQSPLYETEPVEVPSTFTDQLFLNQVVIVTTSLTSLTFSRAVHALEHNLGRTRTATYGMPRTLDIDIIAFGQLCQNTPDLILPHPRARLRRFVLQPLVDLRPDYSFPQDSRSASSYLKALPPSPRVTRVSKV